MVWRERVAEEEEAEELRREQHVIDHEQRQRQHRGGPEDIEEIGQGSEAPLGPVEVEDPVDDARVKHEGRQEQRQMLEALLQEPTFEAHVESRDDGGGRHQEIVDDDQRFLEILTIHVPANSSASCGTVATVFPVPRRPTTKEASLKSR
jgi:hypothetical protein